MMWCASAAYDRVCHSGWQEPLPGAPPPVGKRRGRANIGLAEAAAAAHHAHDGRARCVDSCQSYKLFM